MTFTTTSGCETSAVYRTSTARDLRLRAPVHVLLLVRRDDQVGLRQHGPRRDRLPRRGRRPFAECAQREWTLRGLHDARLRCGQARREHRFECRLIDVQIDVLAGRRRDRHLHEHVRCQLARQILIPEAGHRLALIERVCGDEDQRLHVRVAGSCGVDHRSAVRVADEHDRALDGLEELGDVPPIACDAAQGVGRRENGAGRPFCNIVTSPFQLDESAKAPCTRTIVGFVAAAATVCAEAGAMRAPAAEPRSEAARRTLAVFASVFAMIRRSTARGAE